MARAQLSGNFSLDGSLVGGFSIHRLTLSGDSLHGTVKLEKLALDYSPEDLLKGTITALEIQSPHVEMNFAASSAHTSNPKSSFSTLPSDALRQILNSLHHALRPPHINVRDLQIRLSRDDKPLLVIASSDLLHQAGKSEIHLNLGIITDAQGRNWPAQHSVITLKPDEIRIDRISPLPGLSLENLLFQVPASSNDSSLSCQILWDDAKFSLLASPHAHTAQLDLLEGSVDLARAVGRLGGNFPLTATMNSLSLQVDHLLPEPNRAEASLQIGLTGVSYEDWQAPQLNLDAALLPDRATLTAMADALETKITLRAEIPLERNPTGLSLGAVHGTLEIPEIPRAWEALGKLRPELKSSAPAPDSTLTAEFFVKPTAQQPHEIQTCLRLIPAASAAGISPIQLDANWKPPGEFQATLTLDGLAATGRYHALTRHYQGEAEFFNLDSRRLAPWLALASLPPFGNVAIQAKWSGSGTLRENTHLGRLQLTSLDWSGPKFPPVTAVGEILYHWPTSVSSDSLSLRSQDQLLETSFQLNTSRLEIQNGSWKRSGSIPTTFATFHGSVPLGISNFKSQISNPDASPIDFHLESGPLGPGDLQPWHAALPALAMVDSAARASFQCSLTGTGADPRITSHVEVRQFRDRTHPQIPPADLELDLKAADGVATLTGSLKIPQEPAATLAASAPFLPAAWAANPPSALDAPFSARLDLPKISLARYASLIPEIARLDGTLAGHIEATGTPAQPQAKGSIELRASQVSWKSPEFPEIQNLATKLDLTPQRATLSQCSGQLSGGTFQANGHLSLVDAKPGEIDLRLVGRHLPLRRDASIILRSHADLRLSGPWQRAALTGSVGIVDSLFFRDIEILPIGTPFTSPSAASLPKIDAPARAVGSALPMPFRDWSLDLRLVTQNPFLIRGNIATGKIESNVRVFGTLGTPKPDGVVTLADFQAALPFSTLKVRRGTLRFTPDGGFDPVLEIRGTAEPRPYRVDAYVYGRASNPQLVLTSNPPLPENEIMTLLATGSTTSGLEDPATASSRAMQLFAEELRRGRFAVGKQLRPLLGLLDRVDFSLAEADPYSSDSFSTATLSITDRWFLSAGMGADGDSRVLGIWRLNFR